MDLVMTTDLAKVLPQVIDFNFEELKTQLPEKMSYYKNLVVTEDSIKSAKADKATLNKLFTAFETARKNTKKECLKPYEDFEKKVSILTGMVSEAISAIDSQVKAFDEQAKHEKEGQIKAFYLANIHELETLLPLEKIYNPKWLNAGYKMAEITAEIMQTIITVQNDIGIIKGMHIECEQTMLDTYLRTLNMSTALAEKTRYEAQQAALKEYEQKKLEAAQKEIPVTPEPEPEIIIPIPDDIPTETPQISSIKTIKIIFYSTTAEFRADMKALAKKHAIEYDGLE